jgi:TRAP-type C4-dicarboxylate transport system permease small subunit
MEMIAPDEEPLAIREDGPQRGIVPKLDRYTAVGTKFLFYIAGIGLVGMLVLIVADVIGIKIFSKPVPGGIEYVSFLSVVAIAFAVPFTQVMRGHVAVDFIIEHFPPRSKTIIDVLTTFLSVCVFALLAYYSFKYAGQLRASGEVSMTQKIPFYPFVYGMAVSVLALLLVLILDLVKAIIKAVKTWTR